MCATGVQREVHLKFIFMLGFKVGFWAYRKICRERGYSCSSW